MLYYRNYDSRVKNMKNNISSVKGTRDFYPEAMRTRSWFYQTIRTISERYGYQEYEGPILEKIDLYAAKSGEELVKEQAFVFPDRGGDLLTLRPELTPTLARMVAQQQNTLALPLRWWSFGPFWRYERPQKGRTREFFQWNIDMLGADAVDADAELIAILAQFFKYVGFTPDQVTVAVNNRRFMDEQLGLLDITPELRPGALKLIDRRDKLDDENWLAYGLDNGLSQKQVEGIQTLMNDDTRWQSDPELRRLFEITTALGVGDYVRFVPRIVRGLDYYTGTVFEGLYLPEAGRSICGGGRYDNLVADVGGDKITGTGFAMGDVMVGLLLEKHGLIPALPQTPASVLVTVFDEDRLVYSYQVAEQLRAAGINTISYPEPAKLQKQFKYADRMGMKVVIVAGPDEASQGQVTLKDLASGAQEIVKRELLVEAVSRLIAAP